MKLHVCFGTFSTPLGAHACRTAIEALREAGHDPEVERAYGFGGLPDLLNSPRRRAIKRRTGSPWVPALELDDGTMVQGSQEIADWARANPA